MRIKSNLDPAELERRVIELRPRFRDVPGLIQKIYGRDDSTGDVCGIYFFKDQKARAGFSETELAKTISAAYEALFPLHPERGPIAD